MAEYTYPLSKEKMLEIWEEIKKEQKPSHSWVFYMNGKIVKKMYSHLAENIDENCTYLISFDWGEVKESKKKKQPTRKEFIAQVEKSKQAHISHTSGYDLNKNGGFPPNNKHYEQLQRRRVR